MYCNLGIYLILAITQYINNLLLFPSTLALRFMFTQFQYLLDCANTLRPINSFLYLCFSTFYLNKTVLTLNERFVNIHLLPITYR